MAENKILVIEDDQDIRETLIELLESEGYQTMFAENGHIGLTKLNEAEKLPNLILLDLMMPVKDGFQFCLEKEVSPKFSHLPVVVMSADANIKEYQQRLKARAYVKKPLNIYEVLDMIEKYCTPT